ncbi:MAG TPA: glycosyl transferase, partial [Rhodospirillales bacterium]|nr:glycosyl transferase [Rhodospirillales bacterium]
RVMFYVQHLLGIGHVRRAAIIARAMIDQGLDVSLIIGGMAVPDVDFGTAQVLPLPSVRATDGTFKVLVDQNDTVIDDPWRDRRRQKLLDMFAQIKPHVMLLEMFPFGRRQFRFELIPLLEAAGSSERPPWIVSSVRDILVQKSKLERNVEMADLACQWFDQVLVHGDPAVATFDMTFPEHHRIKHLITYTGYVASPARPPKSDAGAGEIIISMGGGAAGKPLIEAALLAWPLAKSRARTWRFLCGPNLDQQSFDRFVSRAPDGIIIERNRTDFPTLLQNSLVSISQGGYNTIMDVLQAGASAIIAPYSESDESEQCFRADLMQQRGLMRLIEHDNLTPALLARSIDEMAETKPPSAADMDFGGAEMTARMIAEKATERMIS